MTSVSDKAREAQIVVSQAAREAAADLLGGATPDGLLEGKHDSLSLIRALARIEAETLERAAKVCDDRARWHEESFRKELVLKNDDRQTHFAARNREAEETATAIRALKGSGHG